MSTYKRSSKINNNDRRVKRTKKALLDALFELLENKPLNRITVTELTERADINRATFYFYYTDLYDMLEQIQDDAYALLLEVLEDSPVSALSVDTLAAYMTKFLKFCSENYKMCKFVMNNDGNNQLRRKIHAAILSRVPSSKDLYPDDDPRRYLTGFVLTAATGLILDWLNEGMLVEPEAMARFMASVYFEGATKVKSVPFVSSLTQDDES